MPVDRRRARWTRPLLGVALTAALVAAATTPSSAASVPKEFGVVTDAWSVSKWAAAIGAQPTMPMQFEAWSRDRTLDTHFAETRRQGLRSYMVTWEPWEPVPASLGRQAQAAPQPRYANAAIARGDHDDYIRRFARSVRDSGLTVYIRYAHEMNGDWYPWSHNRLAFIDAWRHVVTIFRAEGASNARFVYSTNPNLFQDDAAWTSSFWRYWPGKDYVDFVGSTMINFGSKPCSAVPCPGDSKGYPVTLFSQRLIQSYRLTGKQLVITEFNTALEGADRWLADFTRWLATGTSWIHAVVLSQAPSRGAQQMPTGNLGWNVVDHPELHPVMCNLAREVLGQRPCV